MREQCLQIVNQRMPQLVRLLLGIAGEQQLQEHIVVYKNCLNYSLNILQQYQKPFSSCESVENNLNDFIDRFHIENLKELGETVKMLANILIDDNQCPDRIKWMTLDFMLSVNFRAFRTARIKMEAMTKLKHKLLESLASVSSHVSSPAPLPEQLKAGIDFGCLQTQHEQQQAACSMEQDSPSESMDTFLDTVLEELPLDEACVYPVVTPQHTPDRVAIQKFNEALNTMHDTLEQLSLENGATAASLRGSFARSFGEYIRCRHDNKLHDKEATLLREVLSAFFAPENSRHFVLVNRLIQLRSSDICGNLCCKQLLEQSLLRLQYMQQLQSFIDCYERPHCVGDRLDTLTTMTVAMRRLLKPFVESLIYFEQRLRTGKIGASIQALLNATRGSVQRLQVLWTVASRSFLPWELHEAPHRRCQLILGTLLSLAAEPGEADGEGCRPYAAALLLQMLRVYCQYLDNWWHCGDFNDWYDEFPVSRTEYKGQTIYAMRGSPPDELSMQSIYLILQKHIKTCGIPLALLCDSNRLKDFVTIHGNLFKDSLHNTLLHAVLLQLEPYQIETPPVTQGTPNIFRQMKATRNVPLRQLYYVYYKETLPDFKQPPQFAIEELLKQLQLCASYTPLDELICLTLERQLDQRALLLNSYVLHLLRVQLQVDAVLEHLRCIFLLTNFQLYAKPLTQLLDQLDQGIHTDVAEHLQHIIDNQNPRLGYPFSVQLPSASLEKLKVVFNCDPALSWIITKPQLQLYNAAFRVMLQLQVARYRLQQLPHLPCISEDVHSLFDLRSKLGELLLYHLHTKNLETAALDCDEEMQSCASVPQMQSAHYEFVHTMESLILQDYNEFSELHYHLSMARFLCGLWRRTQHVLLSNAMVTPTEYTKEYFVSTYSLATRQYLSTLNSKAKVVLRLVRHMENSYLDQQTNCSYA